MTSAPFDVDRDVVLRQWWCVEQRILPLQFVQVRPRTEVSKRRKARYLAGFPAIGAARFELATS